jgi:hypothetical protein
MQWSEVIANPYLLDLSFKIELNRYRKMEMFPASNQHNIQFELTTLLKRKLKKVKHFRNVLLQRLKA